MTDTAPLDPAHRFALLIEGLLAAAVAEGDQGFVPMPLMTLIWRRLRRIGVGVAALFARFRAGMGQSGEAGRLFTAGGQDRELHHPLAKRVVRLPCLLACFVAA